MRLLGIGDNVMDHYVDTRTLYPGGNAVNVAVYASRLGVAGSAYIGIVGNDPMGDHLLRSLADEGVDISRVRRAVGPTGSPQVSIGPTGDRTFLGSNKGGVQHGLRLRLTEEDLAIAAASDVVHTSVYSSLESVLPDLAATAPISFDFSDHNAPSYVAQVCPHVAHAFFSGANLAPAQVSQLAATALELGCVTAVVTLGHGGAYVATSVAEPFTQPIVETEVVDTLGAGDGFIAGFLTTWYSGATIQSSSAAAARSAAEACRLHGAFGRPMREVDATSEDPTRLTRSVL